MWAQWPSYSIVVTRDSADAILDHGRTWEIRSRQLYEVEPGTPVALLQLSDTYATDGDPSSHKVSQPTFVGEVIYEGSYLIASYNPIDGWISIMNRLKDICINKSNIRGVLQSMTFCGETTGSIYAWCFSSHDGRRYTTTRTYLPVGGVTKSLKDILAIPFPRLKKLEPVQVFVNGQWRDGVIKEYYGQSLWVMSGTAMELVDVHSVRMPQKRSQAARLQSKLANTKNLSPSKEVAIETLRQKEVEMIHPSMSISPHESAFNLWRCSTADGRLPADLTTPEAIDYNLKFEHFLRATLSDNTEEQTNTEDPAITSEQVANQIATINPRLRLEEKRVMQQDMVLKEPPAKLVLDGSSMSSNSTVRRSMGPPPVRKRKRQTNNNATLNDTNTQLERPTTEDLERNFTTGDDKIIPQRALPPVPDRVALMDFNKDTDGKKVKNVIQTDQKKDAEPDVSPRKKKQSPALLKKSKSNYRTESLDPSVIFSQPTPSSSSTSKGIVQKEQSVPSNKHGILATEASRKSQSKSRRGRETTSNTRQETSPFTTRPIDGSSTDKGHEKMPSSATLNERSNTQKRNRSPPLRETSRLTSSPQNGEGKPFGKKMKTRPRSSSDSNIVPQSQSDNRNINKSSLSAIQKAVPKNSSSRSTFSLQSGTVPNNMSKNTTAAHSSTNNSSMLPSKTKVPKRVTKSPKAAANLPDKVESIHSLSNDSVPSRTKNNRQRQSLKNLRSPSHDQTPSPVRAGSDGSTPRLQSPRTPSAEVQSPSSPVHAQLTPANELDKFSWISERALQSQMKDFDRVSHFNSPPSSIKSGHRSILLRKSDHFSLHGSPPLSGNGAHNLARSPQFVQIGYHKSNINVPSLESGSFSTRQGVHTRFSSSSDESNVERSKTTGPAQHRFSSSGTSTPNKIGSNHKRRPNAVSSDSDDSPSPLYSPSSYVGSSGEKLDHSSEDRVQVDKKERADYDRTEGDQSDSQRYIPVQRQRSGTSGDKKSRQKPLDSSLGVKDVADRKKSKEKSLDSFLGVKDVANRKKSKEKSLDSSLGLKDLTDRKKSKEKSLDSSLGVKDSSLGVKDVADRKKSKEKLLDGSLGMREDVHDPTQRSKKKSKSARSVSDISGKGIKDKSHKRLKMTEPASQQSIITPPINSEVKENDNEQFQKKSRKDGSIQSHESVLNTIVGTKSQRSERRDKTQTTFDQTQSTSFTLSQKMNPTDVTDSESSGDRRHRERMQRMSQRGRGPERTKKRTSGF